MMRRAWYDPKKYALGCKIAPSVIILTRNSVSAKLNFVLVAKKKAEQGNTLIPFMRSSPVQVVWSVPIEMQR